MEKEAIDLEEMTAAEMVKKGVKKGVTNTTRKPWFKRLVTYSGELGIGIDLSKLSVYLDNENRAITIGLPKIDIKYNEINPESFEYYNVSTTIFNQLKMEDVSGLIATLLEKKEEQVLNNKKVMEEAISNTEIVLKNLLSNSDFTRDYKVVFK